MKTNSFDHEKLDVYRIAMEFTLLVDELTKQLPKGRAYLVDQLQRASSSIVFNIAEGSGEFAVNEKIRFYRMAKRSATECAGILDLCQRLNVLDESHSTQARDLLLRVVAMLTKMARIADGQPAFARGLARGLGDERANARG